MLSLFLSQEFRQRWQAFDHPWGVVQREESVPEKPSFGQKEYCSATSKAVLSAGHDEDGLAGLIPGITVFRNCALPKVVVPVTSLFEDVTLHSIALDLKSDNMTEVQSELEAARTLCSKLRNESRTKDETITRLNEFCDNLELDKSDAAKSLENALAEIKSLKADSASHEARYALLEKEAASLKNKQSALEESLKEALAKRREAVKRAEAAETSASSSQKRISALEVDIQSLRENSTTTSGNLAVKIQEVQQAKEKLSLSESNALNAANALKTLQVVKKELDDSNASLRTQVEELRQQVEDQNAEIVELTAAASSNGDRATTVESLADEMSRGREGLNPAEHAHGIAASYELTVEDMPNEIDSLKRTLEETNAAKGSLEMQISAKRDELQKASATEIELREMLESILSARAKDSRRHQDEMNTRVVIQDIDPGLTNCRLQESLRDLRLEYNKKEDELCTALDNSTNIMIQVLQAPDAKLNNTQNRLQKQETFENKVNKDTQTEFEPVEHHVGNTLVRADIERWRIQNEDGSRDEPTPDDALLSRSHSSGFEFSDAISRYSTAWDGSGHLPNVPQQLNKNEVLDFEWRVVDVLNG
ncbi:hypothetical protein CYLTODRAFT_458917 [Cylindrobasidium torrendii FP15055 ss-10]|uniref:Uncharacterized protein n=1 Tax=Cylindrobasidium torrendii FP15055 ss-10 TaxID=1314674 RepID=A0A0D7AX01_9AGAR|nr:hypothetical protein CYLTODRAFT_458917 [Cylindrobasidium torrendii FP15055 ss-10]